jgi:hypothetical protein
MQALILKRVTPSLRDPAERDRPAKGGNSLKQNLTNQLVEARVTAANRPLSY